VFWWGDSQEDAGRHCNVWGSADGFEFVSPVDAFGKNGRNKFGLADMLGNVNEWCLDELDETGPHGELFKGNPGARVLRGGSFHDLCSRARCAYRYGWTPSYSASYYGFRVCCGVPR
jgi:formylglycine-generating enzyme required for sulfatase activity